jgi:hypothetical protein
MFANPIVKMDVGMAQRQSSYSRAAKAMALLQEMASLQEMAHLVHIGARDRS